MEEHTIIEAEIRNLEKQLLTAEVRRCTQVVSELLADEFIEFGSSGRIYNKQQILESLPLDTATRTLSQFTTTRLAPDVMLATFRSTRVESGKPSVHTLRSSIWNRIEGRWKLVFHQGTPALNNS
ncbi:nuclear transport factor 2 family protein [Kaarinaea lacus]